MAAAAVSPVWLNPTVAVGVSVLVAEAATVAVVAVLDSAGDTVAVGVTADVAMVMAVGVAVAAVYLVFSAVGIRLKPG